MKIILFRHGEKQKVDSVVADDKKMVKLTGLGIVQINKLGKALLERFPSLNFSKIIYSSHYARAIQSAEIVKSILNIQNMIIIPEFGEFYASDDYKKPKVVRQQIQEKAMQNPEWISPETGFSLNDVVSKFKNKIKEIYLNNQNDLILISTHGGIIRNTVYSLDPKLKPNNELIAEAKIHEGGYTVLNFDGQIFSVDEFDIHDYLVD